MNWSFGTFFLIDKKYEKAISYIKQISKFFFKNYSLFLAQSIFNITNIYFYQTFFLLNFGKIF